MTDPRFDEAICCVCASQASGFGFQPPRQRDKPIAHTCNDLECLDIAKDSYSMRQEEFNKLEELAVIEGSGPAAEAYCEQIGKSDLRDLTQAEWDGLMKAVVAGYRADLKAKIKTHAPF